MQSPCLSDCRVAPVELWQLKRETESGRRMDEGREQEREKVRIYTWFHAGASAW